MPTAIVDKQGLEAIRLRQEVLRGGLARALADKAYEGSPWAALEPERQAHWLGLADAALDVVEHYDDGLLAWLEDVEQTRLERLEGLAVEMRRQAEEAYDNANDLVGDALRDFAARLVEHQPLPPRRVRAIE